MPADAKPILTAVPTERRRHPRVRFGGPVEVACAADPRVVVTGRLVEVSHCGFRATHPHSGLTSGEEVQFRHALASGRAVVVWTRLVNSRAESGFHIIQDDARLE